VHRLLRDAVEVHEGGSLDLGFPFGGAPARFAARHIIARFEKGGGFVGLACKIKKTGIGWGRMARCVRSIHMQDNIKILVKPRSLSRLRCTAMDGRPQDVAYQGVEQGDGT